MQNFINKYPDSALRLLTRRDLMADPFARNSNRSTKSATWTDERTRQKIHFDVDGMDDLPDRPLHELVMMRNVPRNEVDGEAEQTSRRCQ